MRVKEVLILVLVLFATLVYASPNAEITLTPLTIYETNELEFNLTVNNLFKDEIIDKIHLVMPTVTITDVTTFLGWQDNFSINEIIWQGGTVETNSISLFQFKGKAGIVNNNQTVNVEIITNDDTTDTIQILILDDTTGPILSNPIPIDGGFLRQGITNQTISVNVSDPETGILNGSFSYWDCSANATNVTIYNVALICSDDLCQTTADLSYYDEGETMCFEYIIYNNGLETTNLTGTVGFDGTPPSVELISPDDNAIVDGVVPFIFNATDNLAPTLDCNLLFENNIEDSTIANAGALTTLNFDVSNLTEGNHLWKIICTDGVELEGESEERSAITGSAPEISLNISYIERTIDYDFTATITDETGVDNAYAVFKNQSQSLTETGDEFTGTLITELNDSLGDYILTITAEDVFGFIRTENFTVTLIPGYLIDISISPNPAEPGDIINITGTVSLDDGSDIPEANITLQIENTTVQLPITNQSFEFIFNASTAGNYDITTLVTDSNGFDHQISRTLSVVDPQAPAKASSSSGSSGTNFYCGDGQCTKAHNENCNNCAKDCGSCPEEPEEGNDGDTSGTTLINESGSRTPAGVGSATGFFANLISNPLAIILFIVMAGALFVAAFKPVKKKVKTNKNSKINWKGYFDR